MSLKTLFNHPLADRIIPHLDTFLVLVVSLGLLFPLGDNMCRSITTTGFDDQNLYLWEYVASQGVIPHKDTFFIYGYLQYYRTNTPLAFVIYALIAPVTYTLIYSLYFKRLFKNRWLALVALTCSAILVQSTLGVHGLSRYGLLIISALLTITAITRSLIQPRGLVLIGLLNGLILLASTADGFYAVALSFLLINLHLLGTHPKNRHLLTSFLQNNAAYVLGLGIGFVPLVLLNTLLDNWSGYIQSIKELSYLTVYAKSDYIPTDRTQAMLLATFWVSVAVLSLDSVIHKRRVKPAYWILVSLTIPALIVQQKNLIRSSTAASLSYATLVLLGLIGYSVSKVKVSWPKFLTPVVMVVLTFIVMDIASLSLPVNLIYGQLKTWYRDPPAITSRLCQINQAEPHKLAGYSRFEPVIQYLDDNYPGQKVFPFPYAPMLYIALNQKPAPYPNFMNASSLDAQTANIAHLKREPVNLVIYDLGAMIFDSTSETIANNQTLKYILKNFEPIYQTSDLVILARVATPSAWLTNQSSYNDFIQRLTQINWGEIPKLEGIKHAPLLLPDAELLKDVNVSSLDISKDINDPFIIAVYKDDLTSPGTLLASSSGSLISTTNFNISGSSLYLFRLQNLPQFMLPYDSLTVSVSPPPESLRLYQNRTLDLW